MKSLRLLPQRVLTVPTDTGLATAYDGGVVVVVVVAFVLGVQ